MERERGEEKVREREGEGEGEVESVNEQMEYNNTCFKHF